MREGRKTDVRAYAKRTRESKRTHWRALERHRREAAPMTGASLFPIAVLQECSVGEANQLLVCWRHKMGALARPKYGDLAHVLLHEGNAVAVTTTSTLIRL